MLLVAFIYNEIKRFFRRFNSLIHKRYLKESTKPVAVFANINNN